VDVRSRRAYPSRRLLLMCPSSCPRCVAG
jgi:hypothetical protein